MTGPLVVALFVLFVVVFLVALAVQMCRERWRSDEPAHIESRRSRA